MEKSHEFRPDPSVQFMDQVRAVLRYHYWILRHNHYSRGQTRPRDLAANVECGR